MMLLITCCTKQDLKSYYPLTIAFICKEDRDNTYNYESNEKLFQPSTLTFFALTNHLKART